MLNVGGLNLKVSDQCKRSIVESFGHIETIKNDQIIKQVHEDCMG